LFLKTKNELKIGLAMETISLLNFRNYEIDGKFDINLEPKFKIEYYRVKEHKKRQPIGIFLEKQLKSECKMYIDFEAR